MKDLLAGTALVVIAVAGVGVLGVVGAEYAFRQHAHYAPRYEDVRRETYEHSRAFQEGTLRDLDNLRLEYARGDDAQKAAIADTARHRLADVPIEQLPPALRTFAQTVEQGQ